MKNNIVGQDVLINTLIHQYFIRGGKLDDKQVKEISFQKQLTF